MSHIYVYSPAGAVRDVAGLRRAVARLKAQGHQVEVDPDALKSHQRFAGDDDVRLSAIARAAASGADATLITRGGYGLTRLLHRMPWKAIGRSIERGTQWVGLSDFTALQMGLLANCGLGATTWSGHTLIADFGGLEEPDEITQAVWDELLQGVGEGLGWRVGGDSVLAPAHADAKGLVGHGLALAPSTLWGGTLAVLSGLVGTPYLPRVPRGILFLEDVNEPAYRVERMLTTLLHAGIIAQQRAVLLGSFSGSPKVAHDRGFGMATVARWLAQAGGRPVLTGLPYGHIRTKLLLPQGLKARLHVEPVPRGRPEAMLVWYA
jgi:muramoyltetrapeptide carboxypeptidase